MRSLIALAAVPLAVAASEPPADGGWSWRPPSIAAAVLAGPAPTIDGVLTDPAWSSAARTEAFLLVDGRSATGRTRMSLMRDTATLFLAVECFDAGTRIAKATVRDQWSIWGDDVVEIFLAPSGRGGAYYHLGVNAGGTLWDAFLRSPGDFDVAWSSLAKVGTAARADCWTIELAIPLTSFDGRADRAEWGFNVTRSQPAGELVYWSPVYATTSHMPTMFGILEGMAP
jgi:hypothetical protein